MTEEIYINGVNVAGCEFFDYECSAYRQEYWESEDNTKDMCSSHHNCYYKQLKRLEQENKKLKERFNSLKEIPIYEQCKALQQENKELKIYIESNKQQIEEVETLVMDNDRLQQEVENLKDTIYYDVEKYRSALEYILESAKFAQCLPCGSGNLEDCLNCDDETTNNGQFCMEKRIEEIKTKINEVLTP